MRGIWVNNRRIGKILSPVNRFSSGDYRDSLDISEKRGEIDAICTGLNQLHDSPDTRATVLQMNEVIYQINKLKDSQPQIQTIFKNAPDAVVVIGSNNFIGSWNPDATRIVGWREKEVTAR